MFETAGHGCGIVLNWAVFGSAGHVTRPGGLVIEDYDSRAPDSFGPNCHVKSIINTRSTVRFLNPHMAALDGVTLDATGAEPQWASPGVTVAALLKPWRVNHYFTRSRQDWDVKMARGHHEVRRDAAEFMSMDRNEVPDDSLSRFGDRVRARLELIGRAPTR